MNVPEDLLYTDEHEWVRELSETRVRIGITDYAQDQLGDVVFVELPQPETRVAKEDLIVEVESTKSVGEVYAPFDGTIVAVNQAVAESPELVNQSPYEEAWFAEIETDGPYPRDGLLDATQYRDLTE